MPLKLRQVAAAMPRMLVLQPYDLTATLEIFDGVATFGPLQRWFDRLVAALSPAEQAHLRTLTFQRVDLDALRGLPHGSYGRAFAAFIDGDGLDPEYFLNLYPPARAAFADNWVMYRYAKVHDMLHVILGVSIWMPQEMGLQVFHYTNFREPFALGTLAAWPAVVWKFGHPRTTVKEMLYQGRWGRRVPNLLLFPHEERWAQPLVELRRELGVPEAGIGRA